MHVSMCMRRARTTYLLMTKLHVNVNVRLEYYSGRRTCKEIANRALTISGQMDVDWARFLMHVFFFLPSN